MLRGIDPTEPDPCLWGARVWLRWNRHVETYADHRIRVEDFVAPYSDLAGHLCSVAPGMQCRGSVAKPNTVRGARIGQMVARADKTTDGSSKTIGAPERTGWAQIAAALGFSGAIKGHHREHGTCSFNNMASKDPKLAGKFFILRSTTAIAHRNAILVLPRRKDQGSKAHRIDLTQRADDGPRLAGPWPSF